MISKPVPATQYDECKHGHLYTPENTGWRARTNKTTGHVTESRFCKECKRMNRDTPGGYNSYAHERNISKLDVVTEEYDDCPRCSHFYLQGSKLIKDDMGITCRYCHYRPTAHLVGQLELGGN